jgi:uncharacterized protein YcbK (DUF882 family)
MLAFKTNRIRDEYSQLPKENPGLFELVVDLADYVAQHTKQDLTLTSILRTPEEQAALYAQSQVKVEKSAHLTWEAVDLRSLVFTKAEIADICGYLNAKYKNENGKTIAFCHTVINNAPHFHVQLYRN